MTGNHFPIVYPAEGSKRTWAVLGFLAFFYYLRSAQAGQDEALLLLYCFLKFFLHDLEQKLYSVPLIDLT